MARRSVGSVSRTRVSSVTTPSLSGTLKSTRMKTRFPRRSRSSMVSLFMVLCSVARAKSGRAKPRPCLELGGQELDQVAAAAGVAPLVVVPSQNFHAAVADDLGVFGV